MQEDSTGLGLPVDGRVIAGVLFTVICHVYKHCVLEKQIQRHCESWGKSKQGVKKISFQIQRPGSGGGSDGGGSKSTPSTIVFEYEAPSPTNQDEIGASEEGRAAKTEEDPDYA